MSRLAVVALALAAVTVAFAASACSSNEGPTVTYPVSTIGPATTVSPAVTGTRGQIAQALGQQNLILADTQSPYRPPESAMLASAPRAIYQVVLPADPGGGYIVVYEFSDATLAAQAAAEEVAYLASGPGRVQSAQGTVSTIRQVGPTVVFYSWVPGASPDAAASGIQVALETLGVGFPVPA